MNEIKFNFDLNLDDFDLNININDKFNSRYIKPKYCPEISESKLKYKNAQKLADEITLSEAMRYYVVVDGTFIFGDLLEAIIVKNNLKCKKITISTLSLSENNIDSLHNLIEGGFIEELNIIISDYFYSHERENLIRYMYQELDIDDKFQLAVASSHMKVTTLETFKGNKLVFHGSANMRSSSNLEQLMIEENKDLYDFNNEIFTSIIEKYATVKKSLRRNQLWNVIDNK